MKKKLVVAAVVAMLVECLSSAEIRVDRGGYTDGNGDRCNVAFYWNDKYFQPEKSAKEFAGMKIMDLKKGGNSEGTFHYYFDIEGYYMVTIADYHGDWLVFICYVYENGYSEYIYNESFYSRDSAKKKFDSLCAEYYNKIPK